MHYPTSSGMSQLVYILNIVMFIQGLYQVQDFRGTFDEVVGEHGNFRRFRDNALLFQGGRTCSKFSAGDDLPSLTLIADVFGAGVQGSQHQLFLIQGAVLLDHKNLAFALKHPGHTAGLA